MDKTDCFWSKVDIFGDQPVYEKAHHSNAGVLCFNDETIVIILTKQIKHKNVEQTFLVAKSGVNSLKDSVVSYIWRLVRRMHPEMSDCEISNELILPKYLINQYFGRLKLT